MPSREPWTIAQVEFLRAHPSMSYAEIATALERTVASVRHKCSRMRLPPRHYQRPFTVEEDIYLRENHASLTIATVAAHLGRHIETVRKRSQVLGLVDWATEPRPDLWTEAEIAYLRENYGSRPLPQIAAELGRSYGSTRNKVAYYGLRALLLAQIPEGLKRCIECQEDKDPSEFQSSQSRCKSCTSRRDQEYHRQNRERLNRQARERERRKRKEDPEYAVRSRLRSTFGMTLEEYNAKLEAQGGVCAICGTPPRKIRLAVDHDHECCPGPKSCGKCIRDLLCSGCNNGSGLADKPELLRKRAEYTEQWRDRHTLLRLDAAALSRFVVMP